MISYYRVYLIIKEKIFYY